MLLNNSGFANGVGRCVMANLLQNLQVPFWRRRFSGMNIYHMRERCWWWLRSEQWSPGTQIFAFSNATSLTVLPCDPRCYVVKCAPEVFSLSLHLTCLMFWWPHSSNQEKQLLGSSCGKSPFFFLHPVLGNMFCDILKKWHGDVKTEINKTFCEWYCINNCAIFVAVIDKV